ncbi:hypothetical protein LR48_Vigan07g034800 [Vigna angularis]|uniref:Uncharacterized protein n=2 Tax=Phaseolus angularis TaxID=3914 RepID=A0A0L9UVS5_PHAAN|nr:uncharacterized protein HKW66_Vig0132600 [Vigna angularis]KOM46644.1 hypothetical protein LR48_Vigan07g034800 [Vigna angularis]BAT80861.1 hypothetical protein VIGAN_03047500 [Vigna angularis var. angularis]
MSRHRRQPSQALPPEFFAGDDITKPFDLAHTVAEQAGGAATAAASLSQASRIPTHQEIKDSPRAAVSPTKNKPAPPPKST